MARGIQPNQNGPGPSRNGRRSHLDAQEGQGRGRRAGLNLPLNALAIPAPFFISPDRETVEQGGEALFQYFLQEELQHVGLSETVLPTSFSATGDYARQQTEPSTSTGPVPVSTPDGYKNSFLAQYGRNIKELADEFSRSRERAKIEEQANSVDLNDITKEGFMYILCELFKDGFSRERVIALFFFCFYLIIRAINQKGERLFQELFMWSLQYIKTNVCKWVYEHGGWGRVLGNIYDIVLRACLVSALAVGIVCGIVYIRKNLR